MRYRYIACGTAKATDPLCDFRLLAQSKVRTMDAVWRVILPEDLRLSKYSCDEYSTTNDTHPLSDFQAVPLVRINGKWRIMPELTDHPICSWHTILLSRGYGRDRYNGYHTDSRRVHLD